MKVVLEINGNVIESVDLEKHNRVKAQEATIYLKEKYQEVRAVSQWAVYEIAKSKVAGEIHKMDVLQQKRKFAHAIKNDHIKDVPKEQTIRPEANYSNPNHADKYLKAS